MDSVQEYLGRFMIPLETTPGIPTIPVLFDVISADISALMGMDVLEQQSLTPCKVTNRLVNRSLVDDDYNYYAIDDLHFLLTRFDEHLYAQYSVLVLTVFATKWLSKLHGQFFHPSSEKLYSLLKKARPEDTTLETQKQLEARSRACDPCQRIQTGPTFF